MTTERDDDQQQDRSSEQELPERPQARQEETVRALEERTASDPDDGEQVAGEDVADDPDTDTDEMDGLPGPPSNSPGEPSA